MSWTQYLGNAKPIDSMYSQPPTLDGVRMIELRLHEDGPRVSLRFDLSTYPDRPPSKWLISKFNKAQLTLVLIDIHQFKMDGWSLNNIGNVTINAADGGVKLNFSGSAGTIVCYTRFMEIEKVSGYCASESSAI